MTKIRTLLKSSANADGRHQVLLVLSDRGTREYFNTGFSALPKEFDAHKDVGRFVQGRGISAFKVERQEEDGSKRTYTNKEANDVLSKLEERAQSILKRYNDEHLDWAFEQFRSDFTNAPKREFFLSFAEDIVEKEYRDKGSKSTADTFKYTIKALKRFDPNLAGKTFPEISTKYLERFEAFCVKEGAVPGTISIRMRVIKRIYNIAIRQKLVSRDAYPFSSGSDDGKYKIPATKLTKTHQFLTKESLEKLAATHFDRPTKERDKHLFLFSFYCDGINWKDMALLTDKNLSWETMDDGSEGLFLRYQRAKTHGAFEIFVDEPLQRELDWFKNNTVLFKNYLLPIITKDLSDDAIHDYLAQKRQRFNASLKEIAKELDFPKSQLNVTSYHARHSLAMYMFNEQKSIEVISQTLGHQSVKTTKHYLAGFSSKRLSDLKRIDLSTPHEGQATKEQPEPAVEVARPRQKR